MAAYLVLVLLHVELADMGLMRAMLLVLGNGVPLRSLNDVLLLR